MKPLNNPFKNSITAEVICPDDGIININVYNGMGQLIKTLNQYAVKGMNNLNIEKIPGTNGIYLLSVTFNNKTHHARLIRADQ